ncbi:MAG TPA: ring-cleaving dioxygenase [Thermomicrobiales bacterium]|nr:ring-cleaving dioxygenase [Thermomicrobiales bacterium]
MTLELGGIHHLTAISADIRENYRFYTQDLGMRLVKRSVNQDDVSAYHLFYADALGSPGTDLTFFDWPVPNERRGTRSIVRTALRVAGFDALTWWTERLNTLGIAHSGVIDRDGRATIDFEDREGQRLSLIDDGGSGEAHPWDRSPVPAKQQIRGLGPVLISVPALAKTKRVLEDLMAMREVRTYPVPDRTTDTVHVFEMGSGGAGAELHVAVQPELAMFASGAGGVHHVAFRSADADYDAWADRLNEFGIGNSGKVDRFWFRSLYFREPGGILFEIATDGPGFGVDEDMDTLGEKIVLAPFLESRRDQIVANLKPLD